jgi:glyoxalase superfamily protein
LRRPGRPGALLGYRARLPGPDPPEGDADWAQALTAWGVPEEEWGDGEWLADPDGIGPRIYFQRVPEPKAVKNRLHLDLDAGGGRATPLDERRRRIDAEVERLVAAGATRVRATQEFDGYFVAMLDPEGNEFDVH